MNEEDLANSSEFADVINSWLETAGSNEAKADMLDFAAEIIRNEWVAFSHAKILHGDEELIQNCLPVKYYDESGNEKDFRSKKRLAEIALSETPTVVSIWSTERFIRALNDVRTSGLIYSKRFHIDYFPEIDTAYVSQGNHHAAAAVYLGTGIVYSSVISFHDLFPHLIHDGKQWYNAHTNEPLGKVHDWRFAILYSIKRAHWLLSNGHDNVRLDYASAAVCGGEYSSEWTLTLEQLVNCVVEHRKVNNISLRQFARESGISFWQAWSFDHFRPDRETIKKIMIEMRLEEWTLTL